MLAQVQPSQKLFESQLFHLLQFQMDPSKVVWLEYESFKIGNITVPKVGGGDLDLRLIGHLPPEALQQDARV